MLRVETETATYEPKDFKDLSQEEMSPFNAAVTTLFFKSAGRAKCCVLQGGRWVCWTC
jgi:hypothetical protein